MMFIRLVSIFNYDFLFDCQSLMHGIAILMCKQCWNMLTLSFITCTCRCQLMKLGWISFFFKFQVYVYTQSNPGLQFKWVWWSFFKNWIYRKFPHSNIHIYNLLTCMVPGQLSLNIMQQILTTSIHIFHH